MSFENLQGSELGDNLTGDKGANILEGGDGNDILSGKLGGDTLLGGGSADTLTGRGGNDTLRGAGGDDTIQGGAGDDTVVGSLGQDILSGNAGRDLFDFNSLKDSSANAAAADIVSDFTHLIDDIDLSGIDAVIGAGNDGFDFIGTAQFTAAGQVRVFAAGGDTIIALNTKGASVAEMMIRLDDIAPGAITQGDFIL